MRTIRHRIALLATLGLLSASAFAQSVLVDHRTATYRHAAGSQASASGKQFVPMLVTFNSPSQPDDYEVLGRIEVHSRNFGSNRTAMRLLAEKARAMGANAVIDTGVWQAPAFPVPLAPHGTGIAVRIHDRQILEQLADASSIWE